MGKIIYDWIGSGRGVISNTPIYEDLYYKNGVRFKRKFPFYEFYEYRSSKYGKFTYIPNEDLNVRKLILYAIDNHIKGREEQTLICIDEAQLIFNAREYMRKDRLQWNNFFIQHRKFGFEIIMVALNNGLIDKQIREAVEYEVRHRDVRRFGKFKYLPMKTFLAVTYWQENKKKVSQEFYTYNPKYGEDLYDSYKLFDLDDLLKEIAPG